MPDGTDMATWQVPGYGPGISPNSSNGMNCTAGRFCPAGSGSDNHHCRAGTWRNIENGKSDGFSPTADYNLAGGADRDKCWDCWKGHFCPRGSTEPQVCGCGTYRSTQRAEKQ